ncbi:hypothetical protein [Paramicrobacterium agarici]|uniref:Uncharacterized protein n=1 Tax=Paramicrobacterium agarici TaxID=630514 RepID=A0A2A9DZ08_9MICO|nr:hypothetical protein [Microbacterium agarici]PFG31833.1 hypothetical protein ATJ78_2814 [Microbacterium agarici]
MPSSRTRSFIAGLLVANSAPHLATAVSARRHLTPLGGRDSGPGVNGIWGALNLAGGLALLAKGGVATGARKRGTSARWNDDLPSFEAGCLVFAAWMALSEHLMATNHDTNAVPAPTPAKRRR